MDGDRPKASGRVHRRRPGHATLPGQKSRLATCPLRDITAMDAGRSLSAGPAVSILKRFTSTSKGIYAASAKRTAIAQRRPGYSLRHHRTSTCAGYSYRRDETIHKFDTFID